MNPSTYFSEVTDPRVTGRCLHLLSDILMIGLCTYLTGGVNYEDIYPHNLLRLSDKYKDLSLICLTVNGDNDPSHVDLLLLKNK